MVMREFPRVRLVRNPVNLGFARANNQAAALAGGRWLFFLNNDTLVPRGTLRRLLRFARAQPEVGVIGPMLRDQTGAPQASYRPRPTLRALLHYPAILRWTGLFREAYQHYRGRDCTFYRTRPVEVLMGAALLMRQRDFWAYGPWDEGFTFGGEDIDLCIRVGRHKPVVYYPAVAITHCGRESSRQNLTYAHPHTLIGLTRFLRKDGAPRSGLFLFKAAMTLDAPIKAIWHGLQFLLRRLFRKRDAALRSQLCLAADLAFVRSLPSFWRT
jgi:GT2 family glycosyltransferase